MDNIDYDFDDEDDEDSRDVDRDGNCVHCGRKAPDYDVCRCRSCYVPGRFEHLY
jgi:hypothetical protein